MTDRRPPAGALLLRDLRSQSGPMVPFTMKLPAAMLAALDQTAEAHDAPRASVARSLLALGLEQLDS
jgi:hypothetical protein